MADMSLDALTDEQLLALLRKAQEPVVEKPEPVHTDPVKVTLSDGSIVEAANIEEMNRALLARLNAQREPEPVTPEPPPATPQPIPYDHEKFAKLLTKDGREGLDYVDKAQFGMPVRQMVPLLLTAVAQLAQRLNAAETQQFLDANPEYDANVENRKVIEGIMQQRGWQPTRQSLQDAYDIARGSGKLKVKETPVTPPPATFIPPRTSKLTAPDQPTADEVIQAANDMPIEKLEDLLYRGGLLRGRRQ